MPTEPKYMKECQILAGITTRDTGVDSLRNWISTTESPAKNQRPQFCLVLVYPWAKKTRTPERHPCSGGAGMAQWWERSPPTMQCGPGSTPGPGVICGLSLLLVLVLAPRGFSPGTPVFPSPQKPTFPNSNSIRNPRATGLSVLDCCVSPP